MGFETKRAAGTTSFIIAFSALFGLISKILINDIELNLLLLLGGGIISVLGAIIGSYGMHFKLKPSQIKLIISILVIFVAIKMITA